MKKIFVTAMTFVLCLVGPAVLAEASGRTDNATIVKQIDELLSRIYKSNEPGAAVIAVKEGKVIFRKGYGMADMELGVAVKPEMVFPIGSASKPFTAMAVMLLAERSKLSLGDEITRFLPDYPTQGHKITIRHLLTHTSGIKRLHRIKAYWKRIRKDVRVQELIDFFKDEPLESAPGEKWIYCNSGYHLLGKIIEEACEKSYREFIKENIFDPLGMKNTYFASNDRIISGRVRGYHKQGGRFVNAPFMSYSHLYAAGDIFTSVDDLAIWDEALYNEKLLSKEGQKQLFTPFMLNSGESSNFALGWFLGELKGRGSIYHGGGIYGFVAHTIRLPEEHVYVALLHNCIDPKAKPPTQGVAEMVAAIILGEPFEIKERKAVTLSPDELKSYEGVYRLITDVDAGRIFRLIVEDGRLFLDSGKGSKQEILPESKTTFFIRGKYSIITFEFSAKGEVTRMVIHLGGEGGNKMFFKKEKG